MLIIYVDDFKVAARREDHDELWAALKKVIVMGDEDVEERFLGCKHEDFSAKVSDLWPQLEYHPFRHLRPHLTKEDLNGEIPNLNTTPVVL